MKKGVLVMLLGAVVLLSACGKKEVVTQPIPDVTEQYKYKENSVPVIDAIIDTDVEMRYIEKIQQEYAQFANHYATYVAKSSGLSPNSVPQSLGGVQQGIQSLLIDLEKYQYRISTMNLPMDYKNALMASINAYRQSLSNENTRLTESKNSDGKPSNSLYQQAEEANKKVQQTYLKIRQS